jgi:TonB family protein
MTTPDGLIQIFSAVPTFVTMNPANVFRDPSAHAVLTHRGFSNGNGGSATFDQMEQSLVTSVLRNVQNNPSLTLSRGGAAANPKKTVHVPPVYPESARRANVAGVVILELSVAADGTVSGARILRSIPLLDQPALDAVRQWRFEPTLMNGTAVPVMLTVTVQFPPQ